MTSRPTPAEALAEALAELLREAVAAAVAQAVGAQGTTDRAVAVSIPDAGERLDLGTTSIKRLIAEGQLESFVVGGPQRGRRLIPVASLEEFVARQVAEQASQQDSTEEATAG